MDAASLSLLHRLVSMGSRSLLQYVCQAFPWSADRSGQAFAKIKAMGDEERDATARLTRHLQKKRLGLPPVASFPSHFTTINFVSLDYLVPKLALEHGNEIAEIEHRLSQTEDAEVRDLATHFVERKRRDLVVLQELGVKAPAA